MSMAFIVFRMCGNMPRKCVYMYISLYKSGPVPRGIGGILLSSPMIGQAPTKTIKIVACLRFDTKWSGYPK